MTTVILLGAGASYGSGETCFGNEAPCRRPPLAKDLFNELERWSDKFRKIPESIKESFRNDFEDGMREFHDKIGDIMDFHREMAYFLALFRPGPTNVYIKMIKELGIKRTIHSSLNYDILLEQAASLLRFPLGYNLAQPDDVVRCLKLHGSVNLWPPTYFTDCLVDVKFIGNTVDIISRVEVCNREETLRRCRTAKSVSPAMAMFAKGKPVKVSPSCIEEQQPLWKTALESASLVFVVGVRVNQEDDHIWHVLGKAPARLV